MRHVLIALLVSPFLLVMCLLTLAYYRDESFHSGYKQIQQGMSLEDVEAILGPGSRIATEQIPTFPDFREPLEHRRKPVVVGDMVLRWEHNYDVIYVGFRNNSMCSKCYRDNSW